MAAPRKKLGELLVEAGELDPLQLQSALGYQRQWGGKLGTILIDQRFISEERLLTILAGQFGAPLTDLTTRTIDRRVLQTLPVSLAERHQIFPIELTGPEKAETLVVAMTDPTDLAVIDDVQFNARKRVRAVLSSGKDIMWAIRRHYHNENLPPPVPVVARSAVAESGPTGQKVQPNAMPPPTLPGIPPGFSSSQTAPVRGGRDLLSGVGAPAAAAPVELDETFPDMNLPDMELGPDEAGDDWVTDSLEPIAQHVAIPGAEDDLEVIDELDIEMEELSEEDLVLDEPGTFPVNDGFSLDASAPAADWDTPSEDEETDASAEGWLTPSETESAEWEPQPEGNDSWGDFASEPEPSKASETWGSDESPLHENAPDAWNTPTDEATEWESFESPADGWDGFETPAETAPSNWNTPPATGAWPDETTASTETDDWGTPTGTGSPASDWAAQVEITSPSDDWAVTPAEAPAQEGWGETPETVSEWETAAENTPDEGGWEGAPATTNAGPETDAWGETPTESDDWAVASAEGTWQETPAATDGWDAAAPVPPLPPDAWGSVGESVASEENAWSSTENEWETTEEAPAPIETPWNDEAGLSTDGWNAVPAQSPAEWPTDSDDAPVPEWGFEAADDSTLIEKDFDAEAPLSTGAWEEQPSIDTELVATEWDDAQSMGTIPEPDADVVTEGWADTGPSDEDSLSAWVDGPSTEEGAAAAWASSEPTLPTTAQAPAVDGLHVVLSLVELLVAQGALDKTMLIEALQDERS